MESDEFNRQDDETLDKNKHIMFSYSWTQKSKTRHIYDIIDQEYKGVPKWIDINQMHGNILETMSDAVDNSFLVIIFLSKDYKNSKNCKTEAELVIGKQKKYILILLDKDYPYLELQKDNWLSKMFKNQYYIDLTDMDSTNLNKLKGLINTEISSYYEIEQEYNHKRRLSFNSNSSNLLCNQRRNSKTNKKFSPMSVSPIKQILSNNDNSELDNFILNNNLNQDDINTIKNLVIKTPRTMVPTLKAGGISFKSILSIIDDIKNEENEENDYDDNVF